MSSVRLFDSLTRKKVDFVPCTPGQVGLYACGPTTYNYIHLGNARPAVAFDVAVRHLRQRGFNVTYVRNITDVDDKIIKRANELGEDPIALAARFTEEYRKDIGALQCQAPTHEPRVSETIPEIVALVERLVAVGAAYPSEGDVYFSVPDFASYGALSHQPLDDLKAGARVEVGERKRAPLDFALWKAAKPGEPAWPSPWGPGRPGWHIECSAMSEKFLGKTFDIHGGGIDLAFPHHENERAQSLGANGEQTFARYWLHNGFVTFNGGKISKSDKDAKLLFDRAFKLRILNERHGGEAIRGFLLTTQYRNPINFEVIVEGDDVATSPLRFPGLEEAERFLEYGYTTRARLAAQLAVGKPGGTGPIADEAASWLRELGEALDDDFNTAGALAALNVGLGVANRLLDGKLAVAKDVRRRTLERLAEDLGAAARHLGLFERDPNDYLAELRDRRCKQHRIDVAWVEQRLADRASARASKDFARADELRKELAAARVEIMDTPTGTTWRVTE